MPPPPALQVAMQAHQAGDLAKAHSLYRQILAQQPNHPEALHLLGLLAFQTGNPPVALNLIERAIMLRPTAAEYHGDLALALVKLNRMDDAMAAYQRAMTLDPRMAKTHINMGNVLAEQGKIEQAIACFESALKLNSNAAEAHYNLGNVYKLAGRLDEAVEQFRRAVQLRPDWPQAAANLSHAISRLGRFAEAEEVRLAAVQRMPDSPVAHFNYAVSLLLKGDFTQGWREYEFRPQAPDPIPRWDGGEIAGKTILLRAEQGLGDTIHFIRYVPLLTQRGAKVIVAAPGELIELLKSVGSVQQWIAPPAPAPVCDLFCPLASLPGIFGTTPADIPAAVPYLKPDPALSAKWAARLPPNQYKVGIVWAGRADQAVDPERSIPLARCAPLAECGASLISLQKGPAAAQIATAGFAIADWTADLRDFSDTAALIDHLDLVLTVDSAVAHLAGAMGKPVYLLLPLVPDWRWMLERDDSPWYPTMRLFRQSRLGDWNDPIDRAAAVLRRR